MYYELMMMLYVYDDIHTQVILGGLHVAVLLHRLNPDRDT